ncbi:Cold-responsive protein kinase 1, partial [Camellia lanceoleosa]
SINTSPMYPGDIGVLTDTDHCYCVILNADGGAAFPSEKTVQDCSSSDICSLKINTSSGKIEKTKVKRSKEYAFIQYTSQDDALLALESMDHKVLSPESKQGVKEFLTEIRLILDIEYENLVKLYGCCVDEDHRILVYNYLENNSLAQTLIGNSIYPFLVWWKLQ